MCGKPVTVATCRINTAYEMWGHNRELRAGAVFEPVVVERECVE